MDTYALIIAAAVIEWLVDRDQVSRWTWPGALQAGVWTLAGLLAWVPVGNLSMVGAPLSFLVAPLIFLVRIGWRAVWTNPLRHDESTWATFAPLWLLVFIGIFLGAAFGPISQDVEWAGPVAFHAYFIGYVTNSLFGMLSARTRNGRTLHELAEPGAFWLVNLGLVAFAATEIAMGSRHGAIVMGLGVLLAVATFGYRLVGEPSPGATGGGVGGT